MKIPFKDQSLSRIYLKDSLHHISDVEAFFQEAHRLINDAASGFAQSQPVRVAAKAALEGTTELKALWALAQSSLNHSPNDSLAADPFSHS
jgi:hypothetical protein